MGEFNKIMEISNVNIHTCKALEYALQYQISSMLLKNSTTFNIVENIMGDIEIHLKTFVVGEHILPGKFHQVRWEYPRSWWDHIKQSLKYTYPRIFRNLKYLKFYGSKTIHESQTAIYPKLANYVNPKTKMIVLTQFKEYNYNNKRKKYDN